MGVRGHVKAVGLEAAQDSIPSTHPSPSAEYPYPSPFTSHRLVYQEINRICKGYLYEGVGSNVRSSLAINRKHACSISLAP